MAKKNPSIHEAAVNLFEVIDAYSELHSTKDGKGLMFKGKLLPLAQKERIIAEAKIILDLEFWEIFMADMKQVACRKMYLEGTTPEDLAGGKWILYTLDVIQKKLYNLANNIK